MTIQIVYFSGVLFCLFFLLGISPTANQRDNYSMIILALFIIVFSFLSWFGFAVSLGLALSDIYKAIRRN